MEHNQEEAVESATEFRERLADHPPSCKLVAYVLLEEDNLTQEEIAEVTLLPKRTVRYALNRLIESDLADFRIYVDDPRKRMYYIYL